ncbi:MAG TPA: leucyl aminopeptidase, partial [Chloroflexota bacterium]|nr:leucyl aminopeptidase [Chloroflexota bacterium]
MAALGMGALLGVSEGSEQPPMTIVMTYKGRGGEGIDVALVGKGVTFDTGGISIKPASDMHLMKEDMAGAAATVGAMRAIAQLGVKANVLGIIPAVENMPSGHAMRPGDVLKAMNGKTIEVLNTDAEGRLILADAVAYAQNLGAKKLIDAATLTGAVVVALGTQAAAVLGTRDAWVDAIESAAKSAGERVWPLPLWEEYREQLKSDIADVANVGGRAAGTITGAMFIRQFVEEGVDWAHLDIAGVAWTERECPYLPKGPTGIPVRTFVQLAEEAAKAT